MKIYTAITGNFEPVRHDIDVLGNYRRFISPRDNAKIYKILPHLFFSDDITVWMDGNIRFAPGVDPEKFALDFLGQADIAVFRHPERDCAYQEAMVCKNLGLDDPNIIIDQLSFYRRSAFPENWGLAECGLIVRRNNDVVQRFNEKWWSMICRFSSRDQISFPFVYWAMVHKIRLRMHQGNIRTDEHFNYLQRQSSKA